MSLADTFYSEQVFHVSHEPYTCPHTCRSTALFVITVQDCTGENIWALSVQSVQAVVVSLSPVVAKIAVEWGDLYIAGDVIATVEV